MKMPFHEWFYRTHAYLQNSGKDGFVDYNDTKQVPMSDRFNKLVELESDLFTEQPYGVIANRRGFNKLIDLLETSNYTFEDINDSLIDAYQHSLTNAMSRMLVNTHAVMFKCKNTDKRYVSSDRLSRYYIVDAPFNQLHFGDRDEFIRQQLQKMHTEENDQYIPLTEFVTSPYTDLLGFTLMICVNGKICNDCMVAIDDKGFKFKVNWPFDYKECYFVIYKLDSSKVYVTKTTYDDLVNDTGKIIGNFPKANNECCIVNLYDSRYSKTVPTVPNFGILTPGALRLMNLQDKTMVDFERLRTNEITVVIYALKYFHEVPNLYPAVNYYDIIDRRRIYDETGERVIEGDKNTYVYGSSTTEINNLEICTPPIVLDRNATTSFSTIVNCLKLRDDMAVNYENMKRIGTRLISGNVTETELNGLKDTMRSIETKMKRCYKTYVQGALLTSLVDSERLDSFEKFMTNVNNFITLATVSNLSQYTDYNVFPQLYNTEFVSFVDYIVKPFKDNALTPFEDIIKTTSNYFVSDNSSRFNRPVSEQCFIAMKYDRDENCWLFDVPEIKHFKGVGNAFYINNDLKGDEIFKFFVLYTDTEEPAELTTLPMSLDQVFDFDVFYDEVSKHSGYIRYWNAENKIMKLCKTIYNDYSSERSVQVLSKILKRKLDGEDIIDQYPTDMNYEPSNASSLNWKDYTEISDEAPFAVNFLFYTVAMMNGNEDKLQAYFYRQLIKRMHSPRYTDIDISSSIDRSLMLPVNYSQLSISPIRVDNSKSSIPIANGIYSFYGIPFLTDNAGNMFTPTPYRYTFNVYENETKYPVIIDNDYSTDNYVAYTDIRTFNGMVVNYRHDIYLARLMTRYLIACYDTISYLQTYYKHPFNTVDDNNAFTDYIREAATAVGSYAHRYHDKLVNPLSFTTAMLISNNSFDIKLYAVSGTISSIRSIPFNGRTRTIEDVSNEFIKTLQSVHKNTGFDDGVSKRIQNLYEHFKKINTLQSVYDFLKWVEGIDLEMIDELDNMRSENENGVYVGSNIFKPYSTAFHYYIDKHADGGIDVVAIIRGLKNMLDDLYSSNYTTHFKPIVEYCEDIIENWIFDFFILDDIKYDKTITYSEKPYTITIAAPSDPRFHPKKGQIIDINSTMIFEPIVEKVGDSWRINAISKICEYAFFIGTDYNVSMNVLSESGATIATINGTMEFFRIGSSADDMVSFNQYPYMKNMCVDIQNIHEEFEIINNEHIVNKKFGKMNYELLVGNNYCQLDHTSELILERKTMAQGSIDRIYLPGYTINKLSNHEFGQHTSFEVYFKPSQVLHLPITNDVMTSVGGKYFVGQTLYLVTDDNKYVFPVIVTAVDMSKSSGFVEAEIDQLRAKWLKIDDISDIKRYMESPITCTVIDDNISNFIDEYTNSDYRVYQIPEFPQALDPTDEDNPNAYSMPGDPLYVTMNAPYVYTRLNWIFNQDVENRYMDTHPQDHHMIYAGYTDSLNTSSPIKIKLINHDFEPFTDQENYPVLRTEPDDHNVWSEELKVFNLEYQKTQGEYTTAIRAINRAWEAWAQVPNKTIEAWKMFQITIQDLEAKAGRVLDKGKRIKSYIDQLETPTTWYNVRTYETAQVYINNGRAPRDFGRVNNIRNIPYTDKLDVWIYDWENHNWIDPSLYDVTLNEIASIKIGEFEDYKTNRVMNEITITPKDGFPSSRKIIIYFSYDKSDVFDTIDINPKTCDIRFKPLLTLDSSVTDYDPYAKINIRKQFDGHITFEFDSYSEIPDFSQAGYLFKLPNESGKEIRTPNIRFVGMTADNDGNQLTLNDFDLYIKIPYPNVTSTDKYLVPEYTSTIVREIDGFVPDQTIKLICISNNAHSSYDGNISSVMFEAYTIDDNGTQKLRITNSSLPWYIGGNFTCTVFKDNMYPLSGGLVTVTVTPVENDVVDGNWVRQANINVFWAYKILPEEFVLVPKNPISGNIKFEFKSEYWKNADTDITVTDDISVANPYLFYYNANKNLRYPIGEVRKNEHRERLVIDTTLNPDVQVVKNTFLSICRYAIQKIPKDGIIDMTGYLPTPLSRDHYEFWVNGRCIKDPSDVVILSPTSIQLLNLKSLRNFECVELVDDFDDSPISTKGPIYIDLNGKTYASHKLAVNSGESVYMEDIRYMFNANNQQPMQTYTKSIISNPNNKNIETDILETISFPNENPTYYEELFNVPSINGVDIYDPKSYHLGLIETPNKEILEMFDRVWRREQCTNPLFPMTHMRELNLIDGEKIVLHTKYSGKEDMYVLYATGVSNGFFTFYISNSPSGKIDDTVNTIKIIPFIRTGVFVYVDKSFQGRWLHCTHPNVKPIKIM